MNHTNDYFVGHKIGFNMDKIKKPYVADELERKEISKKVYANHQRISNEAKQEIKRAFMLY
jgi:hypothetical protein